MQRLLTVGRARRGVVTAALAASVGVDEHGLVAARRTGTLVRLRRDTYVLGEVWRIAGPEERLALRARAVLASRDDEAVVGHEAAVALHGLPLLTPVPSVVDLESAVTRTRLHGTVRVSPRGPEPCVVADGYRVVPAAVAIAQVTLRAGLRSGLVALDAALARRALGLEEVAAALDLRVTGPGSRRRAETLLRVADGASESPGETLTRLVLHDLGLTPESQVTIRDEAGRFVARVDLLVGGRVVVEFDGALKYGGADGRAALVAEKRREDELRSLGYVVVRVTWADLDDPVRLCRLLRRALAAA
ncbi:hypothetical protein G7075_01970 [Phycicoccus sp. HDW14]|uniref:hypothetical protein n=1 Tax=Phycicoccus sp. HDW14 TaxID=2714941 RepID=UPI0014089974|nr:hypothetical protein [Phycicoccus sp. HDW14]QIM20201.1 hypothetical protein G7075_01970 [Phycicoccus sp. HDW14]